MSALHRPNLLLRLLACCMVWLAALTMILPFVWMVLTALKTNEEAVGGAEDAGGGGITLLPEVWQWGNFAEAWRIAHLGDYYLNSLIVAAVTTVLAGIHNALAGFAFAKLRFRGRKVMFLGLLITMMLPFQVSFIFAYLLCAWLGFIDNLQALIVPFLASAFGIFYMRQAVMSVPDDLLDAGRLDGFTDFELFRHLVLPSIRPAVAALAIFTFMGSWNSFFWPLVVIDSNDLFTLPLAVSALSSRLYTESWPIQMAAATIITLPVLVVFLVFQRAFVEGVTLTGVKG
ncbi:MAG: carbohydrate ABC transporter permease [Phycisphaeraceae bacterium]|nr:carbohydrate ABC transporter permease [Phycisphaerales bacterium]QOJ16473.1 MAG: carbohydrate ABC transporter permease [Phycisphaeraceae bacterium]